MQFILDEVSRVLLTNDFVDGGQTRAKNGALTICRRKTVFFWVGDEMSNGTVQPGENFLE